jgi:arsenate reductase (glutaredoxin)
MTITVYGIKNCDTMKKARAWLDGHGVKYDFHDYKSEGVAKDKLKVRRGRLGGAAQPRRHHVPQIA